MRTLPALLCATLFVTSSSFARPQQQTNCDVAGLYQQIITGFEEGHPPALVQVTDCLDKVPGMNANDLKPGLPWIEKAIQSPRLEVRSYGFIGLFAINRRLDSESLIGYLVPIIDQSINDSDKHIRAGAISALAQMKPAPPESAISYLLADLQSDNELAPGIVFELVQIDPNREDIATGIAAYMTSQMTTPKERIDTLNALSTKPVHDGRLIALIAENLTSQSEDVEIAAIQALGRSGPAGIQAARPKLQRLLESAEASGRVRAAAKQVLEQSSAKQTP